jgi:hypothetical protein
MLNSQLISEVCRENKTSFQNLIIFMESKMVTTAILNTWNLQTLLNQLTEHKIVLLRCFLHACIITTQQKQPGFRDIIDYVTIYLVTRYGLFNTGT